jgi:hypothetical protein
MVFKFFILLILFFIKTNGFLNNRCKYNNFRKNAFLNEFITRDQMKSIEIINYLTSIKDYTIITIGDNNRYIEDLMNMNNMKVYYANIDNLLDNVNLKKYLKNRYNYVNCDNENENAWIFHRGEYVASRNDFMNLIKEKNG